MDLSLDRQNVLKYSMNIEREDTMARKISAQVANRNEAARLEDVARVARRAAWGVVVDLTARVEAQTVTAAAALETDDAENEAAGVDWLDALLAGGSDSDAAYDVLEGLKVDLIAATAAHNAASVAHHVANARLEHAAGVIIADRRARYKRHILPHIDD